MFFCFSAALKRCKFFKCTFAAFLKSDQVFGHWAFDANHEIYFGTPCNAGPHQLFSRDITGLVVQAVSCMEFSKLLVLETPFSLGVMDWT